MGSRRGWIPAFLLATSWVLGGRVEAGVAGERADSLFQAAMTQVGRVPVKEGIKAFERVLKVDWNYAPAHFEMAKLYMSLNTPENRQHARHALDEAVHLDPENVEFQLTLGELLWAQGFWSNAAEQYEKVAKTHPENVRATFGVGYYSLKGFLKYQDMINPYTGSENKVVIKMKRFAEEDRKKATFYLKRSLALDPKFRDAYYQLGVLYVESKQPSEVTRIAEQLLKQYPGDKDALLFCGLGYQSTGDQERAHEYYTEAIKRMGPEERALMESVDLIATWEEQQQIGQAAVQHQESDSTGGWTDSLERDRFWRRQDPLFLTTFK